MSRHTGKSSPHPILFASCCRPNDSNAEIKSSLAARGSNSGFSVAGIVAGDDRALSLTSPNRSRQHRRGPRGNRQGHNNSNESKCLRGDDWHFLSIIDVFVVTYFLTISTRRFFALPSSERLSAIGFSWPQPTAVSLVAAIPFWTTAFMTDFALCKERVLLF